MSLPKPYYEEPGITIYHGDCRDYLPHLPKVDLVLTDPPYSISGMGTHVNKQGKGTRNFDFFECDYDWEANNNCVLESLGMIVEKGPTSLIFWCGHRQFGLIVNYLEKCQYKTRVIVWGKTCPIPSPPGSGFDSAVELAVYAFLPGRTWNPRPGTKAPNLLMHDSYRHGVPGKLDHPTQKPLNMFKQLIDWCTNANNLILDSFMGSGTTLRAAKDLGRQAIGIEINEEYCEIAVNRLRQEVLAL